MIIGDGSPEVRGELRKTLFRKERASSIVFETGAEPLRLKDNRGGRPKTLFSLQDKKQNIFKPGRVILLKNKKKQPVQIVTLSITLSNPNLFIILCRL